MTSVNGSSCHFGKPGRGQGCGHNLPSEALKATSRAVLKADLIEAESRTVFAGAGEGGEGRGERMNRGTEVPWHRMSASHSLTQ